MSAMTQPRTASPRNSSRSFDGSPATSAHHDRCDIARRSRRGSTNSYPMRSLSADRSGSAAGSSGVLDAGVHVVDRVPHGLQVLEVLVLDAEADGALRELLLERLDELDQRQRVGLEVVDERLALADRARLDLEDVGEAPPDDVEHGGTGERFLIAGH